LSVDRGRGDPKFRMLDLSLAIVHHLAIYGLFGVLIVEIALVERGMNRNTVITVVKVDLWYGILAAVILIGTQKHDNLRHQGEQADKIAGVDCINPSRVHLTNSSFIRSPLQPPLPKQFDKPTIRTSVSIDRHLRRRRASRMLACPWA
jgi:hypothetical protein